jgi:hypothetical protein
MATSAKQNLDKAAGFIQNAAAIEGRPVSKEKAFRQACDENRYLHEQYVAEFNEKYRDKSIGRR